MRKTIFTLANPSALAAFTLILFAGTITFAQTVTPNWSFTGSVHTPRVGHTATLLPDGKVLVAGGSKQ